MRVGNGLVVTYTVHAWRSFDYYDPSASALLYE